MNYIFPCLFLLFLLAGCKNNSSGPTTENTNVSPTEKVDLAEFYKFYNQFHVDTFYQINHVIFPLEGEPSQKNAADWEEGEKFYWQKENWAYHQPVDFETSEFKRKITPINDELVVEYILHSKMAFGMVRRFAKISDEWYLIYYAGMRPLTNQ